MKYTIDQLRASMSKPGREAHYELLETRFLTEVYLMTARYYKYSELDPGKVQEATKAAQQMIERMRQLEATLRELRDLLKHKRIVERLDAELYEPH